ncbi:uncharacterized protein LOC120138181 [Hibiscus syriacus]|uniref:uncharacterized protein LOC120138181 n=1 Tax=Hibiscus syriacus TaxID=106335 RepID=UPI00192487DE|nr:uncharacterized protein LOC120138181 [Hibiscus syriacus]
MLQRLIPLFHQFTRQNGRKIQASKVGISSSMISHPPWIVLDTLRKGGVEAYLVGGCVRDLLLNRIPGDFDVITVRILNRFGHNLLGILLVRITGKLIFFDPFTCNIYDYNDGMSDLKLLKLRTLIPAHVSFKRTVVARILRGLRIAARLHLSISEDTERTMHDLWDSIEGLDKGRLMMEMNYMLSYGAAVPSICLLERFNLLNILLPFQAAYINQQRSAKNSMMLMVSLVLETILHLDKLISCDHPADSSLCHNIHHRRERDQEESSVTEILTSIIIHHMPGAGIHPFHQKKPLVQAPPPSAAALLRHLTLLIMTRFALSSLRVCLKMSKKGFSLFSNAKFAVVAKMPFKKCKIGVSFAKFKPRHSYWRKSSTAVHRKFGMEVVSRNNHCEVEEVVDNDKLLVLSKYLGGWCKNFIKISNLANQMQAKGLTGFSIMRAAGNVVLMVFKDSASLRSVKNDKSKTLAKWFSKVEAWLESLGWILMFHLALVNNPQDAFVVWTFASVLYYGNWKLGVEFARELGISDSEVKFVPEISGFSETKSDEDLAKEVAQLASLVQDSVWTLTKTGNLLESMSRYAFSPCSGLVSAFDIHSIEFFMFLSLRRVHVFHAEDKLTCHQKCHHPLICFGFSHCSGTRTYLYSILLVNKFFFFQVFIPKSTAKSTAKLFDLIVQDVKSFTKGRRRKSREINYHLLEKGDPCETRYVLVKIILETTKAGPSADAAEIVNDEKDSLQPKLSDEISTNNQSPMKKNKRRAPSLYNSDGKGRMPKKQKLVETNQSPSEPRTTATKNWKLVAKDELKRMAKKQQKLKEDEQNFKFQGNISGEENRSFTGLEKPVVKESNSKATD